MQTISENKNLVTLRDILTPIPALYAVGVGRAVVNVNAFYLTLAGAFSFDFLMVEFSLSFPSSHPLVGILVGLAIQPVYYLHP